MLCVDKICLCLSENGILINKKDKIPISLFVIIQNECGHNECFTTSRSHIEHKVIR